MRKLMLLAAMLAMVLVAAAPAFAQATAIQVNNDEDFGVFNNGFENDNFDVFGDDFENGKLRGRQLRRVRFRQPVFVLRGKPGAVLATPTLRPPTTPWRLLRRRMTSTSA